MRTWLLVCISLLLLESCDKFEMRGFIRSYEDVDERFVQSMLWNSINPFRELMVPEDNYTLYLMADSHVGGTRNLNIFMNLAMENNPAAVVMLGDLTTGNSSDYNMLYQNLPGNDLVTSFKIVGNHDLYFDGWKKFHSLFGSSMYYFSIITPVASDLYICLDTGGGTLGEKQLAWLKETLKTIRPEYRNCLVFTHVNLFRERKTGSTNPQVEELGVLMELFLKHQVNMVVTGHDHQYYTLKFGNTTHVSIGALQDEDKNAGFMILSSRGGEVRTTFPKISELSPGLVNGSLSVHLNE